MAPKPHSVTRQRRQACRSIHPLRSPYKPATTAAARTRTTLRITAAGRTRAGLRITAPSRPRTSVQPGGPGQACGSLHPRGPGQACSREDPYKPANHCSREVPYKPANHAAGRSPTSVPINVAPEGHPNVAQRFSAGKSSKFHPSPGRDGRTHPGLQSGPPTLQWRRIRKVP